jgi:hypothetical protein
MHLAGMRRWAQRNGIEPSHKPRQNLHQILRRRQNAGTLLQQIDDISAMQVLFELGLLPRLQQSRPGVHTAPAPRILPPSCVSGVGAFKDAISVRNVHFLDLRFTQDLAVEDKGVRWHAHIGLVGHPAVASVRSPLAPARPIVIHRLVASDRVQQ